MQQRYRSDYPNQVHQLTIAVSKHYFVTRDGQIRWQRKPFDANLTDYQQSGKVHLVNYIVRDHFSGMFYVTLAHTGAIRQAEDFLIEAWSPKPEYPFDGIPEALIVSKSYLQPFPTLMSFLDREGVDMIEATSGFHAGVRDVSTWEDYLQVPILIAGDKGQVVTFDLLAKQTVEICRMVCDSDSRSGRKSKVPGYLNTRPPCRFPSVCAQTTCADDHPLNPAN